VKKRVPRCDVFGMARPFPYGIHASRFRADRNRSHLSSVINGAISGSPECVYASSGTL